MNTGDWVDAALHAVQIAALVVGAAWAYYKFVRGRIFHRRAEVTLEASLLELDSSRTIRARATLKNTGSADIPFLAKGLKVSLLKEGDVNDKGHPQWREMVTVPVFVDHGWIESQETISDETLVPVGEGAETNVLGYRVSCRVIGEPERRFVRGAKGGGIRWTTNVVVPTGPAESNADEQATGSGKEAKPRWNKRMWTKRRSVA
jgi:hypothetical protein